MVRIGGTWVDFMEMAVDLEQLAIDMHWVMHSQGHGGCFESTSHDAFLN